MMTSAISHIYISIFDTCGEGKPRATSAFDACSDIHHIYQAMNLPSDEKIWSRAAGSQSFPYSGFYTHHKRGVDSSTVYINIRKRPEGRRNPSSALSSSYYAIYYARPILNNQQWVAFFFLGWNLELSGKKNRSYLVINWFLTLLERQSWISTFKNKRAMIILIP